MKVQIINGPNLNLLGKRKPEIYGNMSFEEYFDALEIKDVELSYYQSNVEGELINALQASKADGIIINAGAYTHTSVGIRDCIEAIETPVIEVHISNVSAREEFRHISYLSPVCVGCIFGFGIDGYALGIEYFKKFLKK